MREDIDPFDISKPPLLQMGDGKARRKVPHPIGREKKIRFAIGRGKALSEIWTLSSRKNDVYLSCDVMRGRIKLSAHGSGVCQLAFDSLYANEAIETPRFPLTDRTIKRWKRPLTPEVGPLHLTTIYFSAFETWKNSEEIECRKPTELIPPPPPGFALMVPIFISRDDPTNKCSPFDPEDIILGYFQMDSGEYVTMLPGRLDFPMTIFTSENYLGSCLSAPRLNRTGTMLEEFRQFPLKSEKTVASTSTLCTT